MKKIAGLLIVVLCTFGATAQEAAVRQYSLITDMADTSATIRSMGMLLNHLQVFSDGKLKESEIGIRKDGLVILLSDGGKVSTYKKLIKKYTSAGGTIVMDIHDFASLNGLETKSVSTKTIRVKEESVITAGYKKGEPIVYNNKGMLTGLVNTPVKAGISVLGQSDKGDAVLVARKSGKGKSLLWTCFR